LSKYSGEFEHLTSCLKCLNPKDLPQYTRPDLNGGPFAPEICKVVDSDLLKV
jgi:hypothetical protein